MRKKVSFLLSLVMVLSMLPANVLHAAPKNDSDKLKIKNSKIEFDTISNKLKEKELKDPAAEEATIEWEFSDLNYYELVYYSEHVAANPNNMSRITLGFDVGRDKDGKPTKDNTIFLKWKVEKYMGSGQYEELDAPHIQYIYPYGEGDKDPKTEKLFTYTLKYKGNENNSNLSQGEQEVNVRLSNSINVRAFVEEGTTTLKVYVDGLKKGYFTDFELKRKNTEADQNAIQIKKGMVFPGVANTQIIPVHLIKSDPNNITTTSALTSKKVIGKDDDELAGSKPGVKFEFERPKKREGNEFKYVDEKNGGNDVDVTVNL